MLAIVIKNAGFELCIFEILTLPLLDYNNCMKNNEEIGTKRIMIN